MLAGMVSYPLTADPKDQLGNLQLMQDAFWYCGDVQVRGHYPSFSKRVWRRFGLDPAFFEKDAEVLAKGKVDFFTYSYYQSACFTTHVDEADESEGNVFRGATNPYLTYSEWGWSMDPDALRYSLNQIYDRYEVPIMVVENGLGDVRARPQRTASRNAGSGRSMRRRRRCTDIIRHV